MKKGNEKLAEFEEGGSLLSSNEPHLADLLDLMVLCYSQQRLTLSAGTYLAMEHT